MKKTALLPVLAVLLAAAGSCVQRTPPQSAKLNQDDLPTSCPAVQTTAGNFTRVVVVRIKHDTDLFEGLKEAVQKENVKNAALKEKNSLLSKQRPPASFSLTITQQSR